MNGSPDTPRDYLTKPYARVLTPDAEYGGYTAEILEFPGCVTEGDTPDEALENLEAAAELHFVYLVVCTAVRCNWPNATARVSTSFSWRLLQSESGLAPFIHE